MKNENEIRKGWLNLEDKTFKEIETILHNYDYNSQTMLAHFVANICNVDYTDLFVDSKEQYKTHARWLYWFAMRFMTGETYDRISNRTYFDGNKFTSQNVGIGISKMTKMVGMEQSWRNKWKVIKHFIKLREDPHSYHINDFSNPMPTKYKLSLNVPKGMKNNLEIEIKEEK